jgi:Carboxypeptidase regulatory-like domain
MQDEHDRAALFGADSREVHRESHRNDHRSPSARSRRSLTNSPVRENRFLFENKQARQEFRALARALKSSAVEGIMKKRFVLLVSIAMFFVFAASARVPIGTLAGTVLDARGNPVAHAAVSIQTSDGSQPFAAHTDKAGHFQINRIETGQYDLRASFHGATSPWTRRVMVHLNKTTNVVLHLPSKKS